MSKQLNEQECEAVENFEKGPPFSSFHQRHKVHIVIWTRHLNIS